MKELYTVLIKGSMLGRESVKVLADDIQVSEDGVRLYDGERAVAHFALDIYLGVYREPIMVNERGEYVNLNEIGEVQQDEV